MAVIIGFNDSLFNHALQDGAGPVFIFAITPFATGPAADFPAGYELAWPRIEELTNCVLIDVHNVLLLLPSSYRGKASLQYDLTAFDPQKTRGPNSGLTPTMAPFVRN